MFEITDDMCIGGFIRTFDCAQCKSEQYTQFRACAICAAWRKDLFKDIDENSDKGESIKCQ